MAPSCRLLASLLCLAATSITHRGARGQALVTQDERAVVGDAVVLTCRVERPDGSPIQWSNPAGQTIYFGDKRALKDSRIELVHANRSELSVLINNVTLDDEGDYRCSLFTDDVQIVVSELTVNAVPEDPVIEGLVSPVVEGSHVALTCSTSGSKPAAHLTWLRDGAAMPGAQEQRVSEAAWGGRTFAVTSRLAFRATRDMDGARLSCEVAHDALPDSVSASVTVAVHYKPEVSVRRLLPAGNPVEGSELQLQCDVDSKPPPVSVVWWGPRSTGAAGGAASEDEGDGKVAGAGGAAGAGLSERVSLDGKGGLRIAALNKSDNGTYRCLARNEVGTSHGDFTLIVHDAPVTTTPTVPTTLTTMSMPAPTLPPQEPHMSTRLTPGLPTTVDPGIQERQAGTDTAVIGGVVAVVVFATLCLLIVLGRYLARHKGTYLTHEAKGAEDAPDADTAIINAEGGPATNEEKKEYFI